MFGTPGFRLIQLADKLVQQGNSSLFLGYGSSETTIHSWDLGVHKWIRGPYFRFDPTFSSVPSHSFLLSYRKIIGSIKLEDVTELHMSIRDMPCNPSDNIKLRLPLLHHSSPMSDVMKHDESCIIPILHHVPPRHPWRKLIPVECLRNSWVLAINDDEPITNQGAQDALEFLRSKNRSKCSIHLYKHTDFNGTILN